jgi:hypothetical protein
LTSTARRTYGNDESRNKEHRLISDTCARLPTCTRATFAIQEYRGRHFDPAAAEDPSLNTWACRRCHAPVRGIGHQPFLIHLAQCIGIEPVVRDLESLLMAVVSTIVENEHDVDAL